MPETAQPQVAVYIDFDNIVISRYNTVHGAGRFQADRRNDAPAKTPAELKALSAAATVDINAILDFASSFGTIAQSRAYADWSVRINAGYQRQLMNRSVDLTQLFPTASGMKNGADIRLAVDAMEDLFMLPDLTHVVIVAGDSDYIALAQRCRKLGRYVVGIGVKESTSWALAAACSEFAKYEELPGLGDEKDTSEAGAPTGIAALVATTGSGDNVLTAAVEPTAAPAPTNPQKEITRVLMRALRLLHDKDDDVEWLHAPAVKEQMRRINPTISEKTLGFESFTAFVRSRHSIAEIKEDGLVRLIRLRPSYRAADPQ